MGAQKLTGQRGDTFHAGAWTPGRKELGRYERLTEGQCGRHTDRGRVWETRLHWEAGTRLCRPGGRCRVIVLLPAVTQSRLCPEGHGPSRVGSGCQRGRCRLSSWKAAALVHVGDDESLD